MSFSNTISVGTKKVQVSAAALALASAAAITPVVVPAISQAAPAVTAAPILTWGFDQLDAAAVAADNDNSASATAAATATTTGDLAYYLITGVARGLQLLIGTPTYVAIAFTGGLISAVGGFLPIIGEQLVQLGEGISRAANAIAQAIRVGPYATATTA